MSTQIFQIARYLRPRKFKDVIGQEMAVKIVHGALYHNRMLPVCILHGPSGVGKTTIARLIAMWFCCENHIDDEPCGTCTQCIDIINDAHPDVFELDGGAYTGVDDIREMLTNLEYQTVIAQKRIYIIDEAHMLSKHAMTCLLKRFEEPMAHVQFILATTHVEKLPDTMISRSFRVSLSDVSTSHIYSRLEQICNDNEMQYDTEALHMLAQYSYGSMRQALSSLEQINVLNTDKKISVINIEKMFGLMSHDVLQKITDGIVSQDMQAVSQLMTHLSHANPITVVSQILEKIRMMSKSEYLLNFAYSLAESSLVLHKVPFARDLLEICILRAMLMHMRPINAELTINPERSCDIK